MIVCDPLRWRGGSLAIIILTRLLALAFVGAMSDVLCSFEKKMIWYNDFQI